MYRVTYKFLAITGQPMQRDMDISAINAIEAIKACKEAHQDVSICRVEEIESTKDKESSNIFVDAVRGVFLNIEATEADKYAGDKAHDLEVLKKVESFLRKSN